MELVIKKQNKNKIKRAITLVELIIALTITTVLMVLLFSIVARKATVIAENESGTYYCWKDWNGGLYEKAPSSGIQSVSSCRIKIPRTAKNISVHLIGGGSGGYDFEKNRSVIESRLMSEINIQNNNVKCIADKLLYTSTLYNQVCTEKVFNNNPQDILTDPSLRGAIATTRIQNLSPFYNGNNILITKNFANNVLRNSKKCAIEICDMNSCGKYYKLPRECQYYSKGRTGRTNFNPPQAYQCANLGYCMTGNFERCTTNNPSCRLELAAANVNKLKLQIFNKIINLNGGIFKISSPGEYKAGIAEAGKEYVIEAKDIGSGGSSNASGGATKFLNIEAKGGNLQNVPSQTVNISRIDTIDNISNLQSPRRLGQICGYLGAKCNGALNSELSSQEGVDMRTDITLNYNFNLENKDDVTKTGFGLFGASGAARSCDVEYYPIRSFEYNGFIYKISTDRKNRLVGCKNNLNKGMGGAVIIKWD